MATHFDELREFASSLYHNIVLDNTTAEEAVDWILGDGAEEWGVDPTQYDEADRRLLVRYLDELMEER